MGYIREFIELNQEKPGYSISGRSASGQCKFQILHDKIKIKINVKDMEVLPSGSHYGIHFMTRKADSVPGIKVGELQVDHEGRGTYECSVAVKSDKGQLIADYDVIALMPEEAYKRNGLDVALVGYRKEVLDWTTGYQPYEESPLGNLQPHSISKKEEMVNEIDETVHTHEIDAIGGIEVENNRRDTEEMKSHEDGYMKFQVALDEEVKEESDQSYEIEDFFGSRAGHGNDEGSPIGDVEITGNEIQEVPENILVNENDTGESGIQGKEVDISMPEAEGQCECGFTNDYLSSKVAATPAAGEKQMQEDVTIQDQLREMERQGYEIVSEDPPVVKRSISIDTTEGSKIREEVQEVQKQNEEYFSQRQQYSRTVCEEDKKEYKEEKLKLFSRKVENMFTCYPRLQPFKEDDKEVWIRIEPRDMGVFPVNTWTTMNNPFLMTGYYQHRHLLLGQVKSKKGDTLYYVGVPSQYHSRQRRMASVYGFTNFRSCDDNTPKNGEFGYWLRQIF